MSDIGAFTLLAIAVRAIGYAGSLLAMGSGIFLLACGTHAFPGTEPAAVNRVWRRTMRLGVLAALLAVAATLAGLGVRAGRLSGMGISGVGDPMMLQIVWEGAVGTAVAMRIAGLAAVAAGLLLFRARPGKALIAAGAVAVAFSHTFVGHATEAPRAVLAGALTLHLLAAAAWFGSFPPLIGAARGFARADAVWLMQAFGRAALWGVGILVAAGATFAAILIRTPEGLAQSAYGRILLAKLAVVAVLLGLAALNRYRLVPALAAGQAGARKRLVRSIRIEAAAVVLILAITATLTSVASPPPRPDPARDQATPVAPTSAAPGSASLSMIGQSGRWSPLQLAARCLSAPAIACNSLIFASSSATCARATAFTSALARPRSCHSANSAVI